MTLIEFEEQMSRIQKSQPGLSGCKSPDGFEITGKFVLNHVANEIPLYEEYSLTIKVPSSFPVGFPEVWETSGQIPEGFDHVYPDKHLCLAANCEIASILDRDPSLCAFIEELVTSYLYSACYYAKYRVYPFGERRHGAKGLREAYAERYHATSDDTLWYLLGYVAGISRYRGHTACPCRSGRRLRECHGKVVLHDLKSSRYPLYRNEAIYILYDMCNERREKNGTKGSPETRL